MKTTIKKTTKNNKTSKRKDFEFNNVLVRNAFLEIFNETGRKPKLVELADKTGLHFETIRSHVNELQFTPQSDTMRVLTPDVIASLARQCIGGDVRAIKLWMQILEGWKESSEIDLGFKKSIRDLMEEDETE
ncbi:MAG TPA: hypothetical protein VE912_17000 [Bacteroidales bacterium]|nr:hypothetical protein [Bacteroidales bacterium]